jgi:hypothetical protein
VDFTAFTIEIGQELTPGGGDLVQGVQRNKIEVLFVLWSISRSPRCDDGDPQVPSAFVRDGRYILALTKSKTDKN